ncbi:MAG TPA: bifunctional UDP-N-acetylglucosamine diphosphorylase/glucosamine-1-phosphate N-acetyltransferase GlmU [Vicinamibacterales bacterium]|nr:bifunctional UDP-N-acetylglucosamine diphosphorylase/glucosamine-1-phosphate N-acetyltransferase GlmU [Vicinamibacterales bacterium]
MPPLHVLILAAGKGTRMKSAVPKVLHPVAGTPMIEYALRTAAALSPATRTVIVGHEAGQVKQALAAHNDLRFVLQEPQLGTGHAVMQAASLFEGARGTLLLLSGDAPRLSVDTLRQLLAEHERAGFAATVLTALVADPTGYGRILRDAAGVTRIVEHRDATPEERQVPEINSSIYAFDLEPLFPALSRVAADNAQAEYYLTDLVGIYRGDGRRVGAVVAERSDEILGINSRGELAAMSRRIWRDRADALMAEGVTLEDPDTTYVDAGIPVGRDTTICPGVTLQGRTSIGSGCVIHAGVRIVDSTLEDDVLVLDHCLITGAHIAQEARVGPFARIRPETHVGRGAHVGNFVELKKTRLGAGSKAMHLAYLGDATIGERVNVGAGTITCNYDGVKKNPTVIEDGAFIGSDSQLVAPVRVGRGAYVAAGSSITRDVPAGSLGIARGRQENIEGWVERKKKDRK